MLVNCYQRYQANCYQSVRRIVSSCTRRIVIKITIISNSCLCVHIVDTSLTLYVTFVDTFLSCAFALSIDSQYDTKNRCHFDTFFAKSQKILSSHAAIAMLLPSNIIALTL